MLIRAGEEVLLGERSSAVNLPNRYFLKALNSASQRAEINPGGGRCGLQLAGGLKKLSRGRKKFLASGWTSAHPRSDVGLEKLRALCEAYAKRGHKKIHIWSPKSRLRICVASTEHKETSMNDLKMSVALRICRAYTEKKLSSLKIHSMQMLKTTRKVMMQIMS